MEKAQILDLHRAWLISQYDVLLERHKRREIKRQEREAKRLARLQKEQS